MTGLHSSRDAPVQDGPPIYPGMSERQILLEILITLREMKQQEKQYWETWRQAKEKEK